MTSEQRLQKFHTNDVYYPDLGSAPDWLKQISLATRPIRSTTQIRVVTRNQYGISANVAQTPFGGKPVMASWSVSCFAGYQYTTHMNFFSLCTNLKNVLFKLSVGTKICVFAPTLCQFQCQRWRESIVPKNDIIGRKAKYASMKTGDYGQSGQSRFRWNAIVSSWHSNELKTDRLSIPYYLLVIPYFHEPSTCPPPTPSPLRGRRFHARSCFSFILLQPSSQYLSFPIPFSLQGMKIRKYSRSVVLETANHKVSQQIWDHCTFLGKPTYPSPEPTFVLRGRSKC